MAPASSLARSEEEQLHPLSGMQKLGPEEEHEPSVQEVSDYNHAFINFSMCR